MTLGGDDRLAPEVATQPVPLTVLLMGDSYTAGNGARDAGEPAYYGPERCMRSSATWGEQYAQLLEDDGYAVTMLNRACSAATADAVLYGQDLKDSRVLVYPSTESKDAPLSDDVYAAWASSSPRCTPKEATEEYFTTTVLRTPTPEGSVRVAVSCERRIAPQVDALNRDVDLVLLTLGGNDVHFPDIVRACLIVGDVSQCQEAVEAARAYIAADYAHDLAEVFGEIVRRTGGHARIAYLAYPGLEVNDDLSLTQVSSDGVSTYPVAAELAQLASEGVQAQRAAADAVNAAEGAGTVTFVDEIPDVFAGHEPDARPRVANPDRWIYEVFETTRRDEWYHLKPEGHAHIARLLEKHGAFGARDDDGQARDIALVIDDTSASRTAVEAALEEPWWWSGALVAVIEERSIDGGTRQQRRVVSGPASPADALAAVKGKHRPAWDEAAKVRLETRWNASPQTVVLSQRGMEAAAKVPMWAGPTESATAHRGAAYSVAADSLALPPSEQLKASLAAALHAPHAWAGGPYVEGNGDLVLSAKGSVGEAPLRYAWDLDGDGEFETGASGPLLRIPWGTLRTGWVAVKVTAVGKGGSVALAWVNARSSRAPGTPRCAVDGDAPARGGDRGAQMCDSGPWAAEELERSSALVAHAPSLERMSAESGLVRERALAALMLVPLYAEPRTTTARSGRVEVPTRAGSASRARAREVMLRESRQLELSRRSFSSVS